jgi:hypothetical protein
MESKGLTLESRHRRSQLQRGVNRFPPAGAVIVFADFFDCPGVRRPLAGKHVWSNDMFSIFAWKL